MGDVFDAMKRAAKEKQNEGGGRSAASGESGGLSFSSGAEGGGVSEAGEASGGLPLSEVRAAGAVPMVGAEAEVGGGNVKVVKEVAGAMERAELDQTSDRQQQLAAIAATERAHAGVNGYSPDIIVHHDRGSLITEQYRAIRTQVLARCRNRRLQTHVFTSAVPQEGKTITTLNLGLAFSELRNKKVLLMEADVRKPSFSHYFSRENNPGLLQYLRGDMGELDEIIHTTVYDNLQYIPAGGHEPTHATQLLSSPRMVQLLDRLRDRYDFIFIDAPPVVAVTDPCILGALADQVIMVVRLNHTPAEVIERAKRLLRAANCEVSGVILTHLMPDVSRYVYRYAYGKYYRAKSPA